VPECVQRFPNELAALFALRSRESFWSTRSSNLFVLPLVCRGQTAEEATENVLREQLAELEKLRANGQVNVDSIDVFCEKGVFDLNQSRRILEAGRCAGLRLNFHADELNALGGAEVCLFSVLSISHWSPSFKSIWPIEVVVHY
jgi:imidazolonepropionase-like amidohydrolase